MLSVTLTLKVTIEVKDQINIFFFTAILWGQIRMSILHASEPFFFKKLFKKIELNKNEKKKLYQLKLNSINSIPYYINYIN